MCCAACGERYSVGIYPKKAHVKIDFKCFTFTNELSAHTHTPPSPPPACPCDTQYQRKKEFCDAIYATGQVAKYYIELKYIFYTHYYLYVYEYVSSNLVWAVHGSTYGLLFTSAYSYSRLYTNLF